MKRTRGFTLLEVVVAMAVMAMTLGAIYEAFGWSLRRSEVALAKESAWQRSQSVLSMLRVRESLPVGTLEGEIDGVRWRAEIRAHDAALSTSAVVVPVELSLVIPWGRKSNEFVELKSIELTRRTQ